MDPVSCTWDKLPFDNQVMVWQILGEHEREERYWARMLRFKLKCFVREDQWRQLSQGIKEYVKLSQGLLLFSRDRVRRGLEASLRELLTSDEADQVNVTGEVWRQVAFDILAVYRDRVRRGLEASLRELLTSLFQCDEADQVNVTGEVWRQVVFDILAVYERAGGDTPEIRATSADGLHRIRLLLLEMPDGGPTAVSIRYYGPQRFNTGGMEFFWETGRGGNMHEFLNFQAPVQVQGLDDSRVFENWHLHDDGARGSNRNNAI
jgi:hypothetical protein